MGLNMAEWIWTSSALIVMVFLIRQLLKRRLSAKLRYGIWFLVLLRLLLPFSFFSSEFGLLGLMPVPTQISWNGASVSSPGELASDVDLPGAERVLRPGMTGSAVVGKPAETAQDGSARTLPWTGKGLWDIWAGSGLWGAWAGGVLWGVWTGKVLWGVWAAGMAVTALILAGSNLLFYRRLLRSRKRLETERAFPENSLPIYLTEAVPVPCMAGLLQPAIYVREQDAGDEKTLSYILRHEYTHYLHRDHIWSFLRGICLILHWYHPLVWAAAYCSKQDAELACDESVVEEITDAEAQEYGKVLLSLTLSNPQRLDVLSCATTFGGGKRYLRERISRIARKPQRLLIPAVAAVLLCAAALFFTFAGRRDPREAGDVISASGGEAKEDDSEMESGGIPENGDEMDPDREPGDGSEVDPDKDPGDGGETDPDRKPGDSARPDLDRAELVLYAGGEEEETEIFIRDYPADMNGDGITDILRLSSIQWACEWDESLDAAEDLRRLVEENDSGYYQIAVYDGARAGNMGSFRQGMPLAPEAVVETFELAQAHAGNVQYSYFTEDGKGCLVWNSPYTGMGQGGYSYEVFTYTEDWKKETVEEASVSFVYDAYTSDMWVEREEFIEQFYPIEDMIRYTEKLKTVLDKSTVILDTSRIIPVFSTCFEDTVYVPDAYDIWSLPDVDSAESLREGLMKLLDEIMENMEVYRSGE